jgi:hypothetical protein
VYLGALYAFFNKVHLTYQKKKIVLVEATFEKVLHEGSTKENLFGEVLSIEG